MRCHVSVRQPPLELPMAANAADARLVSTALYTPTYAHSNTWTLGECVQRVLSESGVGAECITRVEISFFCAHLHERATRAHDQRSEVRGIACARQRTTGGSLVARSGPIDARALVRSSFTSHAARTRVRGAEGPRWALVPRGAHESRLGDDPIDRLPLYSV